MATAAAGETASPQHVIIDCDPGIDDAMALLLAFSAPERCVVDAVTTVMGNAEDVDMLARNACLIAHMAREAAETTSLATDFVVVPGARKPLTRPYGGQSGVKVHAENGLGNVRHPFAASAAPLEAGKAEASSAAEALVRRCAARPGEITIVALGPLTNVAAACLLSPEFPATVRKLIIMGGTVDGRGNKAPAAEANVHNDPEAAKVVFQAFPDIVMAGLNLTRQVNLSDAFRDRIAAEGGAVGEWIRDITQHYVTMLRSWGNKSIAVHDSAAVMALLEPGMFQSERVCVDVESSPGALTDGVTVADWLGHWGARVPQTTVLTAVDEAVFHDTYVRYISRYARMKSFAGVGVAGQSPLDEPRAAAAD